MVFKTELKVKLIFISGQPGSGKTSVANELLDQIKNAALIEADSLVITNPWEFSEKTDGLAIKNAIGLVNNFAEAGFKNTVITGLIRNQKMLDDFFRKLEKNPEILFVWLSADKELRKNRKKQRNRDGADDPNHIDFVENLIPDLKSIEIKNGKSIFVNTSSKTIEEIVKEIKKYL